MSSITLTLSGNSSHLHAEYFPPIDLSGGGDGDGGEYVCGLVDFQTFNTIPNVDETNNMFYYGSEKESATVSAAAAAAQNSMEFNMETNEFVKILPTDQNNKKKKPPVVVSPPVKKLPLNYVKIPTGSYDLEDLEQVIKKKLSLHNVEFALTANKNTLECEIFCSQPINFTKPNSIGPLLGFQSKRIFAANRTHISHHPAEILRLNVVRIECNIIKGAYLNNEPAHTIYEFSPAVDAGYKIIEKPQNVIYFPITVRSIHDLNLSIVDQDNRLVNFRGETITIRLHIKKV